MFLLLNEETEHSISTLFMYTRFTHSNVTEGLIIFVKKNR